MATGHKTHVDNYRMIITAKYGLHHSTCLEENAIIISVWDISVVIATKQNRQITIILAIFKSPYTSNIPT